MKIHEKLTNIILSFYKRIVVLCGCYPFVSDPATGKIVFGSVSMITRTNIAVLVQLFLLSIQISLEKIFSQQLACLTDPEAFVTFVAAVTYYVMMFAIFLTSYFSRKSILKCLNQFSELKTCESAVNAAKSHDQYKVWIKFVFDHTIILILSVLSFDRNNIYTTIYFLVSMPIYSFISTVFYSCLYNSGCFVGHIAHHTKNSLLKPEKLFKHRSSLKLFRHKTSEEIDFLSQFHEKIMTFSKKVGKIFQYILISCYASMFLGLIWTVSTFNSHFLVA